MWQCGNFLSSQVAGSQVAELTGYSAVFCDLFGI